MKKLIVLMLLLFPAVSYGWTVESTFEDGVLGTKAEGPSGFTVAGTRTLYSDTVAHSGDQSAKIHWIQGQEGFGDDHGEYHVTVPYGQQVWVRGYYYFPPGFDFTGTPVCKFIRLKANIGSYLSLMTNADVPSTPNIGKLVWNNDTNTAYNGGADIPNSSFGTGSWHYIEMTVKISATAPLWRVWVDDNLVFNSTIQQVASGTFIDLIYFFTMWNDGSPATQDQYVDDVIITTDFAGLVPQVDSNGYQRIGPTGAPIDTTLPSVTLTAPANGATLTGTVSLTATASDNVAVSKVEFYRGGSTLIYSDTSSPYSYAWNTASVANGSYSITAKAYDTSSNTQTSTAASVTVSNAVSSSCRLSGSLRASFR